jgi:TPP-dependent pyruvate/acetoin dehydrogenase alpha subunit
VLASEASGRLAEQTRLELYRLMVECRALEKRAYDLFMQNLIKGTSHLALGQEAVAAGFGAAMRDDDFTFCTYRGHNHTYVRGASMASILGELMHLTSTAHGAMGSYAIIGAHLPIAAGAAWSAQYRGSGQVAVCFFGDGTTNIGAFHEALNFAVIWSLPVVFVCENNLYMEYTPIGSVTAVPNPAADRAMAYGLEPILIDGNDADEVYLTASFALERARRGDGPSLIEAQTYRHGGHSRADPGKYRPEDELKSWLDRDPIPMYRRRLLDAGISPEAVDKIDAETAAAIDAATETARNSSPPPIDIAHIDVWADGSSEWRN